MIVGNCNLFVSKPNAVLHNLIIGSSVLLL